MPLMKPTPSAPVSPPPVVKPDIAGPEYKGVTVNTRYVPQSSLLTNIEGSGWTVDYYSQVVGQDNALSGQQMTLDPTHQQYKLIRKLELKVQTPLTSQQDQEDKRMHVTGMAVVYPFLIPQEGDMFLADMDDGQEGVFRITNSERRTYMKESCYEIQYVLIDYSTPQRRGDLARKIVQEYVFVRDFLIHGQNPLILPQDYQDVTDLTFRYHQMIDVYFNMFSSPEFRTLIMPGQRYPVYDHFLMKAVTDFFTTWDSPLIRKNHILNADGNDTLECFTIWDAILRRDNKLLPFINKRAGLLDTRFLAAQPMYGSMRYSGIKYVVYPTDEQVTINYEVRECSPPASIMKVCSPASRPGILDQLIGDKVLSGLPYSKAPLIHLVNSDDYYIFSQAFYQNTEGQSMLELMVRDYLHEKAPDRRTLMLFTECWQGWPGLERFYYTPMILMLIRAAIRWI